jgi:negative regulator of sigma E activity
MVTEEQLSRLFDGETADLKLHELLEGIDGDGNQRERWTLFSMLSDALVGVASPDDGYSQRIIARLQHVEPEPGFDPIDPNG